MPRLLALLFAVAHLFIASSAWAANEYRAGSASHRLPNPVGAPLLVEFTFRATFAAPGAGVGTAFWGDGTQSAIVFGGTIVGSGVEPITGVAWTTREVKINHTYSANGTYTARVALNVGRDAALINGPNTTPTLFTLVELGPAGNTGSASSTQSPYLALQATANSFVVPFTDYEGDPLVTCRAPTPVESGLSGVQATPAVPNGGAMPTYTMVAQGCKIDWDLSNAVVGERYTLFVVMQTSHAGTICRDGVEMLVQIVPPPCIPTTETCNGLDDNCNQVVDDVAGIGTTCLTGLPSLCGFGISSCANNALLCTPDFLPGEVVETCNAVDDDCDGATDEGNPGGGLACSTAFAGVCAPGVSACTAGQVLCIGAFLPGELTETCGDAVDSDCDGAIDNNCPDSDSDGLFDFEEAVSGCDPTDQDTDDDGVTDGDEPSPGVDTDRDGLPNGSDPDSDDDGLFDGTELGLGCNGPGTNAAAGHCLADADNTTTSDPLLADTDGGGARDGSEDLNFNGKVNFGETDPATGNGADDGPDADGDGLGDALEARLGSSSSDTDSDDDGVPDGREANIGLDPDSDGVNNVLDPDSDDDGLLDGTELGFGCLGADTDVTRGVCREDFDLGSHITSPSAADTDRGGTPDGAEDLNLNGVWEVGESNAEFGFAADDVWSDLDGDGLSDSLELALGADPLDLDSDDDGVLDADEANPGSDPDFDGVANVADEDADGDGLFDGTELGLGCADPATDTAAQHCVADGDGGATTTDPLDPDSDGGGAVDGAEDTSHDGVVDTGETDPNAAEDDRLDPDSDGLFDDEELVLGSDPLDADSDNDGALDGEEPSPSEDADGDSVPNVLDKDSDGDLLPDGLELGLGCAHPDTDPAAYACTADGDAGATKTNPLDADTDGGTLEDAAEDTNRNGVVDDGETDPNVAEDDVSGCTSDGECGDEYSAVVCNEAHQCVPGCRGTNGNGCATGLSCSSTDDTIGACEVPEEAIVPAPGVDSGCTAAPRREGTASSLVLFGAAIAFALARWRRYRARGPVR